MQKLFLFIIVSLLSSSLFAVPDGFTGFEKGQSSFSFFAGQPTFFRYNKFLGWRNSWSLDGGYHFDKYPYVATNYAVYFYNVRDRLKREQSFFNSLLFYAGPGLFLGPDFGEEKSDEKLKIGVRVFGGIEYIFRNSSWSVVAEFAPAMYIEGNKDFIEFQGMLALTYYIGGIKKKVFKSRSIVVDDEIENTPIKRSRAKTPKKRPKKSSNIQGDVSEFDEFD